MYKFYKTLNKAMYVFGCFIFTGGISAFVSGMLYVCFICLTYASYEVSNILDNFVIFYFLAYCLVAIRTGLYLIDEYKNCGLKKSKRKSFLEIKVKS